MNLFKKRSRKTQPETFEFKANDAFHLWNRGFAFQGVILQGKIKEGDKVLVHREHDVIRAKVSLLVNLNTRQPIEKARADMTVALNLVDFSDETLNEVESRFNPDQDDQPPIEILLGTKLPIRITNAK